MTVDETNKVLLPVMLDGKKQANFMLDTGMQVSALSDSVADELQLARLRLALAYGMGGHPLRDAVTLHTLQLGDLVNDSNMLFAVVPNLAFEGKEIGGLLSADYVGKYNLELNFLANKANFFSQDHCKGQVVYWAESFVAAPIEVDRYHRIVIQVKIDDKPVRALIGTGSGRSVLWLPDAARLFDLEPGVAGVEEQGTTMGVDGFSLKTYVHRFKTLEVAGITFRNPQISLLPKVKVTAPPTGSHIDVQAAEQPEMILGIAELKRLHLYIAYDEHMLYATPAAAQ